MINQFKKNILFLLNFSLWNALLFGLIGARYLYFWLSSETLFLNSIYSYDTFFGKIIVYLFAISTFAGHFSLLASLPCLILLPFALFFNKSIVSVLAILVWTVCVILLTADNIVFSMFHFHLNMTIIKLVLSKEYGLINFLELSKTDLILIFILILITLILESVFAKFIWRQLSLKNNWQKIKKSYLIFGASLLISYGMFSWSVSHKNNIFAQQTPNFPAYNHIFSLFVPSKHALRFINRVGETNFAQPLFPIWKLHYPRHNLHYSKNKKLYNIVVIGIDSWRFDAFNKDLTPHINRFSKKSWVFQNHFSGGNATQPGLFSLFYSLPSNYWSSMLKQKQGAIIIDAFLKNHYDMNVFFSSNMSPPFHKTIFKSLKNLRIMHAPGETIADHDRAITHEFQLFLKNRNQKKAFFSFLFYDSAHSYLAAQNIQTVYPVDHPNEPQFTIIKNYFNLKNIINRYKNAVHFLDSEINKILLDLNNKKLLDHTVVIITSDHGEEFDDNHMRYFGHGGNYTAYQVQVPFILYWPKEAPKIIKHRTSHYDLVPFLMKKILACQNPIEDYSVGESLLKSHKKNYLLVGSYLNMGFIEKNQNTTLLTTGDILIKDLHAHDLNQGLLNVNHLNQVLLEMRRFYVN